ncbi:MAG: YdeI/OmpD-associated family protein [Actinobacteria bacterium]|nr:YdeI/OmpD-associated family protein [Actinomycetota bacterium]
MTESTPLERFHPKTRLEWRRWLQRNHATSSGLWLVSYKKATGKPRIDYEEAVEEALCFGWVDSKAVKLDDERSMQMFTPRKPKSAWSKSNKERVARLINEGHMAKAGLDAVARAKETGSWTVLDSVEALEVPPDLAKALTGDKKAKRHFDGFPPSSKKIILSWIASAKRKETRQKRVSETVRLAAQDVRANHPR